MGEMVRLRDRVTLAIADGVVQVRLSRPERMNAIDGAMFAALAEAIDWIAGSEARCVVLSGEGGAFCAGLDREMFGQMLEGRTVDGIPADLVERTHRDANLPQHVAIGWRDLAMPVVAAIRGAALGGGLQIALGADIRIVSPDARLALLEMRWGLVPDMAALTLLPSCVRDDVLRELLYTGREVGGEEAVAIGLATRVAADPLAAATVLAQDIAARSPSAVRAAKRLANATLTDRAELLLSESEEQQQLIGGADQGGAVAVTLRSAASGRKGTV